MPGLPEDWPPREEEGMPGVEEPDCDPLLDGIELELPPERLELLPELPELPLEDEEGEPGGLGELVEEDCC